jgi:hypothetical protein
MNNCSPYTVAIDESATLDQYFDTLHQSEIVASAIYRHERMFVVERLRLAVFDKYRADHGERIKEDRSGKTGAEVALGQRVELARGGWTKQMNDAVALFRSDEDTT